MIKAVCAFSGGLDSMLAAKIVAGEGVDVEGLYFKTGFGGCGEEKQDHSLEERAKQAGIRLEVVDVSRELLEIVRSPRFGYGKNMNPCMDCHALFFMKCAEHMKKTGGSFIVTGEVVGERPMSQRKWAMRQIDRFTALEGLILRPLSAKLLDKTLPEEKGWVKRENLFDISGRSRKPQMALARRFGITSYPNAAGGCLLTDREFSRKLMDLMDHEPEAGVRDVAALRMGRHFRLPNGAKFVIGRDEKENEKLLGGVSSDGTCFMTVEVPGPVGVLSGKSGEDTEKLAASIVAAYSDASVGDEIEMNIGKGASRVWRRTLVGVPSKKDIVRFLV
jgi:tRNA-uridine 2-sulfurtransferase